MPIVTEVRFAHADGALADTLNGLPELEISVIPEAGTNPERSLYLFRIESEADGDVEAVMVADHTVRDVERVRVIESERTLGVDFARDTQLLAPKVTDHNGLVLEARSSSDTSFPRGWRERWLLPDREALHDIWQVAREAGFEFEVLEFHQRGESSPEYPGGRDLTGEQREALVAAYEHGYFVEPRETSLEELAAELDLSPTAVAGRLKRGMRSLIGMTVVGDRRDR